MIGDAAGHVQANSGKKRDEMMSDTVREPISIRRGYAERQEQEGGTALCHQCPAEEDQSVQFAITLIQGKWKIGILSSLQRGPARLSQLCRMFPEASKKMLTQHLREMERDGLIIRTDLSDRLKHVEYSLSDSGGLAVLRLINILTEWGSEYASSLPKPETVRSLSGTIDVASGNCESSSLRLEKVLLGSR
jgi:DNA-binding HxlR family transcriptional regulator